jgi:hypothetical protein
MKENIYIKLYPSLNKITGSHHSTTIMSHLEYWFEKFADGFYKFIEPCNHKLYREGDSWTEVLEMNRFTFTRALKNITARYSSRTAFEKEEDPFQGKFYASYYDRYTNRTFFIRNHQVVEAALKEVIIPRPAKPLHHPISKNKGNSVPPHIIQTVPDLAQNIDPHRAFCSVPTEHFARSPIYTNTTSKITSNISQTEPVLPSPEQPVLSTSKQEDILIKMMEVWNSLVEEGKRQIELTKKRAAFLRRAFTDAFQEDLNLWKNYCQKIASSKFLMGKINSFKATIDFALKFETIQKIKEGQYGVVDIPIQSQAIDASVVENEILNTSDSKEVKEFREKILKNIGVIKYKSIRSITKGI